MRKRVFVVFGRVRVGHGQQLLLLPPLLRSCFFLPPTNGRCCQRPRHWLSAATNDFVDVRFRRARSVCMHPDLLSYRTSLMYKFQALRSCRSARGSNVSGPLLAPLFVLLFFSPLSKNSACVGYSSTDFRFWHGIRRAPSLACPFYAFEIPHFSLVFLYIRRDKICLPVRRGERVREFLCPDRIESSSFGGVQSTGRVVMCIHVSKK